MNEINIDGKSKDIVSENISKLKELFPDAITENKVDFEKLQIFLGKDMDDSREKYSFTWPGKTQAIKESQKQSSGTLRPCKEESKDWDSTNNLYIEGDNLEVLKLLQKGYYNKIKAIYIDPPYNTGNDFIYNDDYKDNLEYYLKISGQLIEDDEAEKIGIKLSNNLETNGRFHSDWLNMMYPRIKLARNLLTDDGVIFISIDENEVTNLKKLCDDIFGEENYITSFIWEKTQHFGRQKLNFYSNAEYVLCYCKRLVDTKLKEVLIEYEKSELEDAPLYNASNPEKPITFPKGTVKFNIKDGEYTKSTDDKYILETPVIVKNGKNENDFILKFRSRWSKDKVIAELENGTNYWVKSSNFAIRAIYGDAKTSIESPRQIIFTNSNNPLFTKNRFGIKVGTSEEGSKKLEDLLENKYFSYPKPSTLIEYLLSLLADPSSANFIDDGYILDFFSGSSTTAQSIFNLNSFDGGNRKFIMVQIPEATDEDSEAYKSGFFNLCEIGKERIRKAGDMILNESENKDLDIGFRVFKLDSSNLKKWEPDFNKLNESLTIDNVKKGRTNEDLVYEIMLKYGIDLTLPIEKQDNIYSIGFGALVICLDSNITKEMVNDILKFTNKASKSRVVFKDSGFASDADKTNIKEILKINNIKEFITI